MVAPVKPVARLARALREPGRALRIGLALVRGHCYKAWYRLIGKQVTVGRNFRVFGSLRVRGKGRVVFGDDVVVLGHVTPWTYDKGARIVIGDQVMLGDTRFGCVHEIVIGRNCLLGRCRIMDTDFHSVRADRRFDDAPVRVAPVFIADNVWIGQDTGILPGTRIGENSVVSFGAVCVREYPSNVVITGNPARVVMQIPMEGRERVIRAESAAADEVPAGSPKPTLASQATIMATTLILISLLACGESRVQPVTPTGPSEGIPDASELARLRSTKIFFGHQSVGANVLAGMREVLSEEAGADLPEIRADDPASVRQPALIESYIGRNAEPRSKSDAFVAALRNGLGPAGGVALFKYCYLDVGHDTDVQAMFESYRRAMETVREAHPEIVLVHVTLPLTEDEDRLRRLVKLAMGRPTGRDLNAKRNAYNALLQKTFASSELIFDLARIESTRSDGTRTFFQTGPDTVYTLAPERTDDGAHLNRRGRVAAGRELLRVLAAAAERTG
ncbi:MAG: acyltransferase [Gemmatimonadales bacterium]